MNRQPSQDGAKSERHREIIAAAMQEFYEQGFAAARLDAIAERAGVAKGTVYLYFDSKEALFEGAVRSVILPVIEHIEILAHEPTGLASDLLKQILVTFYTQVIATDRRRLLRLLISEGPRFPNILVFYHREVVAKAVSVIRSLVSYGVQRGEFRTTAAVDFPMAIFGAAIAGAVWTILFEDIDPIDLNGLCETHLDIVLNGLKAPMAELQTPQRI